MAAHLQVPLPYLLHRAQTRYEEDLRGLQGIRGALSPTHTAPSNISPTAANPSGMAEYFPGVADRPTLARLNTYRLSNSSSARGPSTPLGVRARLNSLGGHARGSSLSQQGVLRPAKKVSSSSTLTLQGPRRSYTPLGAPLSPAASRPESEDEKEPHRAGSRARVHDDSDEEEEEEELFKKEEEELRKMEEMETLERKLRDLTATMTKDSIGFVPSPPSAQRKPQPNGKRENGLRRDRPHSLSSASLSSVGGGDARPSPSRSQQSLSSMDSPHGSLTSPSPSSPRSHSRRQSHDWTRHAYTGSLSPPRAQFSPPALSPRTATGHTHVHVGASRTRRTVDRLSEHGSEASSFSDLSGELRSVFTRYCNMLNLNSYFQMQVRFQPLIWRALFLRTYQELRLACEY